MNTKWIVVANSVTAKIYETKSKTNEPLTLITELNHPEGAKKGKDLVTDRPGHYQTSHEARSSYEEPDAKEVEHERFALEIVHSLEKERNLNRFQSLILIMPAHFLGLIEKHLSKPLQNLIVKIIQKNVINITEKDLIEIIKKY